MKQFMLLISALICLAHSYAQEDADETKDKDEGLSKNGHAILPKAGDIALGINAVPVFGYFGNLFNGTSNNTITYNFINSDNTIYFKYFLDDQTAIRAKVRLGNRSTTDIEYVTENQLVSDPLITVEDKEIFNTTNVRIGAGYEKRRGYRRVQGFYGVELALFYIDYQLHYEYGNDYSQDFTNPEFYDYGNNIMASGGRATEIKYGKQIGAQAGVFFGVEYFFAPKLCVGGEFTWMVDYSKTAEGETTGERWIGTGVETYTEKTGGGSSWGFDTGNAGGAIFLLFHF